MSWASGAEDSVWRGQGQWNVGLTWLTILVGIYPRNPASPVRARPVSFKQVEFTMPDRDAAPRADFLDLLLSAMSGVFPGQVLEALIARLEVSK